METLLAPLCLRKVSGQGTTDGSHVAETYTCFPRKSGAQTHRYYHTNRMEQENCPLDLGPSSNRAVEVHQSPVQVTAGQSMGGKSIPLLFVTYNWPACACALRAT